MRNLLETTLEGISIAAFLYFVANGITFAALMADKHVDYIPWLHFPLKMLSAM